MKSFWSEQPKPIFALAPMANVTDAAFRRLFATYGKPDVLFTEFVSVEGLLSKGKEQLLTDLWFSSGEHPIVAQVFGSRSDHMEQVAALIAELGFDGLDINMGCPDRAVEKQGAGAALIKNPSVAAELIRAAKRGAPNLSISVKTRIGYVRDEIDEWLPALLQEDLAALTVHLRTRKEMSDCAAHWERANDIVALREKFAPQTALLGNGDIETLADARAKCAETGLDGVMIGRGAFGQPWFFSGQTPPLAERLGIMAEHAELFGQLYGPNDTRAGWIKQFATMKKHFKAYVTDFPGAKELRIQLMATESSAEVRRLVEEFIEH